MSQPDPRTFVRQETDDDGAPLKAPYTRIDPDDFDDYDAVDSTTIIDDGEPA